MAEKYRVDQITCTYECDWGCGREVRGTGETKTEALSFAREEAMERGWRESIDIAGMFCRCCAQFLLGNAASGAQE